MATEKFSHSLPLNNSEIKNPALQGSIHYLKKRLENNFQLLKWSEGYIAVPLEVEVNLPTLGNYEDIDIRAIEPIIIVFNINDYPSKAPMIFTDRLDFPKNKLAHLYISKPKQPCAFCYVRGNNDDWYANKRIQDLIIRIENWLRDAATGDLTQDGNQFDPLRLEGYSGTVVYDYDILAKIVHTQESLIPKHNWTAGLFERILNEEIIRSYRLLKIVTSQNFPDIVVEINNENVKSDENVNKKHYRFGYILWSNEENIFSNFKNQFPENWGEFKELCNDYLIDYKNFENFIASLENHSEASFPLIVGIKRPTNLIGFSSNIEFINFKLTVQANDIIEGGINNNTSISFQAHNQPLTLAKAQIISDSTANFSKKNVAFGCGALGSKIIMHFAKAGQTSFTLIDPDQLSPHNIVRHALTAREISKNKASALVEIIKEMFPLEQTQGLLSGTSFKNGVFEKQETFKNYDWIFDFTASEAFFNKLVLSENMNSSIICSINISDYGNLGIMLKEGKDRNPRIDDLQVLLYHQYKFDSKIRNWLMREEKKAPGISINVGVGCNSETTILSDSKVSNHASYFAGAIEHEMKIKNFGGKINLNQILDENEYSIETKSLSIEPLDILTAINDSSWSIRFKKGILDMIKKKSIKAFNIETGGVFVGMANYKTKTIHVVDLISAPSDSQGDSVCFYRGHLGLSEKIKEITKSSGGQLGYIGEWHSHPDGPNGLSCIDMISVKKFKTEFDKLLTPLPVFLTVVAPQGILPFVF